jgi:hypothetical protein
MADILILCPTFDHADTLFASIASAQAQTEQNWEMVVLCDGSPPRTHQVLDAIMRRDPRISSVRFEKSVRYGENHRDPVIRRSSARMVCQLSDDDLWLPDHLAVMRELLADADWANQAPIRIEPGGQADWWPTNLGTAAMRASLASGIPLSAGPNFVAYRREAYLALPEGWTCAPVEAGPSDAFMWSKFFRQPALKIASSARTTALKLPSQIAARKSLTPEDRLSELTPWLARLARPGLERQVQSGASVLQRLIRLFALHGTGDSPSESAALAGLAPGPADMPARPALDGAPMPLPLTLHQESELAMAHAFLHAASAQPAVPSALADSLRLRPDFWRREAQNLAKLGRAEMVDPALALVQQAQPA